MNEEQKLEEAIALFNVDTIEVSILDIKPNTWNPNVQSDHIFDKLKGSIKKYGFLQPILVRKLGTRDYEIIDGYHRYKAMLALGKQTITVNCIREEVPDMAAKFLTLLANKLKGQHDVLKEAKIYLEAKNSGQNALFDVLPEKQEEIEAALKFIGEYDVNQFKGAKPPVEEVNHFAVFMGKLIAAENVGRDYYKKTRSEKMRLLMEAFFELTEQFKEAAKE